MKTYDEMFRGQFSPRPEVLYCTVCYRVEPAHTAAADEAVTRNQKEPDDEVQGDSRKEDAEAVPAYEVRRGLFGGASLRRIE